MKKLKNVILLISFDKSYLKILTQIVHTFTKKILIILGKLICKYNVFEFNSTYLVINY